MSSFPKSRVLSRSDDAQSLDATAARVILPDCARMSSISVAGSHTSVVGDEKSVCYPKACHDLDLGLTEQNQQAIVPNLKTTVAMCVIGREPPIRFGPFTMEM